MFLVLLRLTILIVVAGLLAAAVVQVVAAVRRRRRPESFVTTSRREQAPPHQRVTDDELDDRATQLRQAIDQGQISLEEAVASLVRYGGAGVTPARARILLTS